MTPCYRIWSERVPIKQLCDRALLAQLQRFSLRLLAAVRPAESALVPDLARACAHAGVALALWPMLDDRDGRWANARNAERFAEWVGSLVTAAQHAGVPLHEIALDLEPGIDRVGRHVSRDWKRPFDTARARALPQAAARFAALIDQLRAQGVRTTAAVIPLVLFDTATRRGWQRVLETPIESLEPDGVHAMLYTSMLEGWSRGALRRRDARALLSLGARAAVARWGPRAGVSLGAVDVGAFGNEPTYRSVEELRDDVGIVRAAGVEDIALFDLAGCLARKPAERWFEVLTETPPTPDVPPMTARASITSFAGIALSRVLDIGAGR